MSDATSVLFGLEDEFSVLEVRRVDATTVKVIINSATRPLKVRIEYCHPIRSAMTVAGIVGHAWSHSRIRGSNESTTEPRGRRRYAGGWSAANAFFTVFFEHPHHPRDHLDRHPFRPMQPADLRPILHTQHPLPPDLG